MGLGWADDWRCGPIENSDDLLRLIKVENKEPSTSNV